MLNGDKALAWANWFQGLIKNKYTPAKSGTDPFADFVNGKSAMVWSGSWSATNLKKVKDGVVMPPPDFGTGPKIGGGSWQWGISSGCQNTAGALDYLKFSLQPKYLSQFVTKLNLIPATEETAAMSPGWEPGGDKRFFLDESQKFALIRPPTPAYPYTRPPSPRRPRTSSPVVTPRRSWTRRPRTSIRTSRATTTTEPDPRRTLGAGGMLACAQRRLATLESAMAVTQEMPPKGGLRTDAPATTRRAGRGREGLTERSWSARPCCC